MHLYVPFFSPIYQSSVFCSSRSDVETRQAMENLIGHVMTSTTQVSENYTINDQPSKRFMPEIKYAVG